MTSVISRAVLSCVAGLSIGIGALAKTGELAFERKDKVDVFSVNQTNQVAFSVVDMPYQEWLSGSSGRMFPMDVAPVFTGMVQGSVRTPEVHGVDKDRYEGRAREFAEVVNFRNKGGRQTVDLEKSTPSQGLERTLAATYVVESVFSTVIDKPFNQMKIDAGSVSRMAERIDVDHFHYQIPGTFVQDALEKDHSSFSRLDPNRQYLLSVFDLDDYQCAVLKTGIRDYYSQAPEKERLQNESIYVISQVDLNAPVDLVQAEKLLGRRPEAVITQEVLYADHLIRGGKTIFAFFSEGARTRIVLISNLGIGKKFLVGRMALATRGILLDGVRSDDIRGKVAGAVLDAVDAANGLDELISGATKDIKVKNTCDRGVALGLVRYSQNLFSGFVQFATR